MNVIILVLIWAGVVCATGFGARHLLIPREEKSDLEQSVRYGCAFFLIAVCTVAVLVAIWLVLQYMRPPGLHPM
jgi:hypothetical protein